MAEERERDNGAAGLYREYAGRGVTATYGRTVPVADGVIVRLHYWNTGDPEYWTTLYRGLDDDAATAAWERAKAIVDTYDD